MKMTYTNIYTKEHFSDIVFLYIGELDMNKSLSVETIGKHKFLSGSQKTSVGEHTFYQHDEQLQALKYKGDNLVSNLKFHSLVQMREWVAAEIYKLEMGSKVIPNHSLSKGMILVVHTNPKNPKTNQVRFYQVTELLDVCNVCLRELDRVVEKFENHVKAIPKLGSFLSEEVLEHKVISNSIKFEDGSLAVRLTFDQIMIAGVLPLKIYTPQPYGFTD